MAGLLQLERGHKFWAPETARLQPYSYHTLHRNPSKVSKPTFPVFMHKNNVAIGFFKAVHTLSHPGYLIRLLFSHESLLFQQEKTEFQIHTFFFQFWKFQVEIFCTMLPLIWFNWILNFVFGIIIILYHYLSKGGGPPASKEPFYLPPDESFDAALKNQLINILQY